MHGVLAALQQFELGIDFFDGAGSVFPYEIFHHYHIAGLCHGEIRFGGDDQAERLQLGRGVELAIGSVQENLADIGGAAFGGNRPHYISQILGTVAGGGLELLHTGVDFDHALLAFHAGLASGFG